MQQPIAIVQIFVLKNYKISIHILDKQTDNVGFVWHYLHVEELGTGQGANNEI